MRGGKALYSRQILTTITKKNKKVRKLQFGNRCVRTASSASILTFKMENKPPFLI